MSAKYDTIGVNYAELRKPNRRIADIIESALGSAQTVLNVGVRIRACGWKSSVFSVQLCQSCVRLPMLLIEGLTS